MFYYGYNLLLILSFLVTLKTLIVIENPEEDMSVIKQIIELSLKDKEINNFKDGEEEEKLKYFNPHYNTQPVQPTYEKILSSLWKILCGIDDNIFRNNIIK